MSDAIQSQIKATVEAYLHARQADRGYPPITITAETDVFGSGLLDSHGLVELVMHVEEACGLEIDFLMVDPDTIGTFGGLVDGLAGARELAAA